MSNKISKLNNNNWVPNPLDSFALFWLDNLNLRNEKEAKKAYDLQSLDEHIRSRYELLANELDQAYMELCQIPNHGSNIVSGNSIPNYFEVELSESSEDRLIFHYFLRMLRKSAKDYQDGTFADVAKYC